MSWCAIIVSVKLDHLGPTCLLDLFVDEVEVLLVQRLNVHAERAAIDEPSAQTS
jgi:hypothetical protein